jgi:uncharacterized membrane protein
MADKLKPDAEEIKSALDINKSWSDRIALFITDIFGSIFFLSACLVIFVFWVICNTGLLPGMQPFDKYPFPGLEMAVSLFAVILSVSVLISQNRQGKMEKIRQQLEFEVNVRAENEITKILQMLHELQKKMGIDNPDSELEIMKKSIDLQQLHQQMGEAENKSETKA